MSVNQSRGDRNEPPQYRKPGRSGNSGPQRNFSGGRGGGGGSTTTGAPSTAFYSGKSFKKVVTNAQGAQPRVTVPNANPNANPNVNSGSSNSSTCGRGPQNVAHNQPVLRGIVDVSSAAPAINQADASVQKSTPGVPKVQQSNTGSLSFGTTSPSTLVKDPADAAKGFSFQFGSIINFPVSRARAVATVSRRRLPLNTSIVVVWLLLYGFCDLATWWLRILGFTGLKRVQVTRLGFLKKSDP